MRFLGLGVALALVLGSVGLSQAEPLDLKKVPADAKWVAHVDFDAVHASTVVHKAMEACMAKHKEVAEHLAKVREKIGMDPRTDLHAVTAYGKQIGKPSGVLIVHAKVDQKLLLAKAEKAPDHKVTKVGPYSVHTWTHKGHGKPRTVAGTFYKPDCIVFASSVEELAAALKVLDGKAPAAGSNSPLAGRIHPGTTVTVRVAGLGDVNLPGNCPLAKQLEAVRISMGENAGQSFFAGRATMKTAEAANQVKAMIEGGKAIALAHTANDADAKKLVDALNVTAEDKVLHVRWGASANDVWNMIQKHAKKWEERRAKMGPGKGPWQHGPQAQKPAGKCPPGCTCPKCQAAKGAGKASACPPGCKCPKCQAAKAAACPMARPGLGWPAGGPHGLPQLNLTPEQKAKIAAIHKEAREKFLAVLTPAQKEQLKKIMAARAGAWRPGMGGPHARLHAIWQRISTALQLTDAQKAQCAELKKVYGPKFREVFKKLSGILTEEQKKARAAAIQAARASGKGFKEAHEAALAAVKLTPAQKAKVEAVKKEARALRDEVKAKFLSILTPEQKAKVEAFRKKMEEGKQHPKAS